MLFLVCIMLLMVSAYILIKLVPGFESGALSQLRIIPGISNVSLVFGQWDAVAVAEAKTLGELSKTVISQIRGVQGIQDTMTLVEGVL